MTERTSMTADEIKAIVAEGQNCAIEEVCCRNCKYWGWNRGKVMNSMGECRCYHRKDRAKTWSRQFCRGFEKMLDK